MIGLVVVGHDSLAENMVAVLNHVMGTQNHVATVGIQSDQEKSVGLAQISQAIASVDQGQGVIVVTDLCGSTPTNLALEVANDHGASVLSGANIPMLIKIASIREQEDLDSTVHIAIAAGGQYIRIEGI